MNPYAFIPLAAFLINEAAWVYVFAKSRSLAENRAYLLFAGVVNLWLLGDFFTWLPVGGPALEALLRGLSLFWMPSGVLLLNFVYTSLRKQRDALFYLALALALIGIPLTLFTDLVVTGYQVFYWGANVTHGPLFDFFTLVVISGPVVYAFGLALFWVRRQARPDPNLTMIFIGGLCWLAVGIFSDVILPGYFGVEDFPSLAGPASCILSVIVFIGLVRHGFLLIDLDTAAHDLFNHIGDGVLIVDLEGRVAVNNAAAEALFAGQHLDRAPVTELLQGYRPGEGGRDLEVRDSQGQRILSVSQAPVRRSKEPIGWTLIVRDLTQRQQLREEIIKRQRMESIGTLAGGIAHDFNNTLMAILGNLSLARMSLDEADPAREFLHDAERAAGDARYLTQQLLTFSRGGEPIKEPLALPGLINDAAQLALSGSSVRHRFTAGEGLWRVLGDRGQLKQVLNNVLLNARQAMPEGGGVETIAANVTLGEGDHPLLTAGQYVHLEIRDSGVGIPAEELSRIFEPYFTTKDTGTGLGLASAYSIVKRHLGQIEVVSVPRSGTTVHLILPATEQEDTATTDSLPTRLHRGARILVMDDEHQVRKTVSGILARYGYEPETAAHGREALSTYRQAKEAGQPFDLVLMDLTIPGGMGGRETMTRLLEFDPAARAIASSGYSNDPVMANHTAYGFRAVVAKPFEPETLISAIESVIAAPK